MKEHNKDTAIPADPLKAIESLVLEALNEVNLDRDAAKKLDFDSTTVILGKGSDLDSLEFLNFVISLEGKLRQKLGLKISMSDGKILMSEEHPFQSVEALCKFLHKNRAA